MAGNGLGYADYLKAAFRWRVRLPALGELPLNYLGLGTVAVLGIANPGFWFLGAAAELVYLLALSTNERFHKLVSGERLLVARESWQQRVDRALGRLGRDSQQRYQRLLDQCRRVLGVTEQLDEDGLVAMRDMRTGGLNQILWIFLRLLSSREVLLENSRGVDKKALEKQIEDLERRVAEAAADSALARSLTGTLEIQRRRLENLKRAKESLEVIDAELVRIENQVVLLREESAVSGKAEMLSSRLDAVTGALRETNRWMEQNAQIFGELGADPLGSAPADLPELPPTPPLQEAEQ
jgi:hypothetical protein